MDKKDKIDIALEYAMVLLDSVGLSDWEVGTNRSTSVVAITNHDEKTISYSDRYITIATKEDFHKATMHEAAHALLGRGKGHGKEFVEMCTRLCPDEPFSEYCTLSPIHRYKMICNVCGHTATGNKKVEVWCGKCAENGLGIYKKEVLVNKLEVRAW